MSGTVSITVASPPTTTDVATSILAFMSAQSGVLTDYNIGSQIRTLSEATGSVVELQTTIVQALVFQGIVYAGFAAFGIQPILAQYAVGMITFSTAASGTPPPASQSVLIPAGTLVTTVSGIQFTTTAAVSLMSGQTSVNAPIAATTAGSAGNVSANTITLLVSAVPYPVFVTNALATNGGSNAESPSETLARFTALVLSIGKASPVSIANACIGVSYGVESVEYATCYEPWITQPLNEQVAGYTVCIDNGSGSASSGLIAATASVLNGSFVTGAIGDRPAGVPYVIQAVEPVGSYVVVAATLLNSNLAGTLTAAVSTAVTAYYETLNFGATCEQSQIIAAVANALSGYISSLSVILQDSTYTDQTVIAATDVERVVLSGLTQSLT